MTTVYTYSSGSPAPPALPARNRSVSTSSSVSFNITNTSSKRRDSTGSAQGFRGTRKMTNTVRASNKAAIIAVGEELRLLLHEESPPLIKDRRYHLRTYQACFVGHEMVDWLLKKGEVESRNEAVAMMQKLIDNGVIHHVCDDHVFKDEKLFYRFRKDDGTFEEPPDAAIIAKGQRIYSRIRSDGSNLIQDRKYYFSTYKQCFVGREFVDWLISRSEVSSRKEAVELGKHFLDTGVFRHVCDDHHFKDEFLFYRFNNDEKPSYRSPTLKRDSQKHSRKNRGRGDGGEGGGGNGGSDDSGNYNESSENQHSDGSVGSRDTPTPLQESVETDEYVKMQRSVPETGSFAATQKSGQDIVNVMKRPTVDELMDPNGAYTRRQIDVVSDPVGYGFVIRGSRPVYVHAVDPNGPASAAGLKVGEYLYSVNGQNVLNATHTDAARIILMGSSTASLVTFVEQDTVAN